MKRPPVRSEEYYKLPAPDMMLLNAGTLNPMDREQRFTPANPKTATDLEPDNGK